MYVSEAISFDKTFRNTNDRFKLTRFQVFFLFWLIDSNLLVFRIRDVKVMHRNLTANFVNKLMRRGYLTKEKWTYTITEKAIQDKKYFEVEYRRRLLSGNVWV